MENQQVEEAPKPALPLLALLALASALGVAVAIALAALAMLLAAPAYADPAGTAGGGLMLERSAGLAWADRLFVEIEAQPQGVTRVVEAYENRFDEPLAGLYVYRLPDGAVLERLTFAVGDAEPRPALFTRRSASALVERTARIGPGESLVVELEYRTPSPRTLRVSCC